MNQILKRQTSRFHYGSKVPAVTRTVFITILKKIGKIVVKAVPNHMKQISKTILRHTLIRKIFLTFLLTFLSLYIFTIWKCIVLHRLCRDGIYFDKILVSEYILFEFCLKNMWNCSLTQQRLSHSFYDWKMCELFLLSGFLICHVVGWYIELQKQKFWWRIHERKILISGYPKDL